MKLFCIKIIICSYVPMCFYLDRIGNHARLQGYPQFHETTRTPKKIQAKMIIWVHLKLLERILSFTASMVAPSHMKRKKNNFWVLTCFSFIFRALLVSIFCVSEIDIIIIALDWLCKWTVDNIMFNILHI